MNKPSVSLRFAAGSPVGRRVAMEGGQGVGVRSCNYTNTSRLQGALV